MKKMGQLEQNGGAAMKRIAKFLVESHVSFFLVCIFFFCCLAGIRRAWGRGWGLTRDEDNRGQGLMSVRCDPCCVIETGAFFFFTGPLVLDTWQATVAASATHNFRHAARGPCDFSATMSFLLFIYTFFFFFFKPTTATKN